MKYVKYGACIVALLFAVPLVATGGPTNLTIDISNSNCNDNSLVSGACGCDDHCHQPCSCKKKKPCGTIFEARFNASFEIIPGFFPVPGASVTVIPYIQDPHCVSVFGEAVTFVCENPIPDEPCGILTVNQCLRTCFECDGTYSVGLIIESAGLGFDLISDESTVCACGITNKLPDLFTAFFSLAQGFDQLQLITRTDVTYICCDNVCDCTCCDVNCKRECTLPYVTEFSQGGNTRSALFSLDNNKEERE